MDVQAEARHHLRPTVRHGPDDGGDIITALNRTANPKTNVGAYSFYYFVIEGFDDYGAGKAPSISGLKAVDDQTLEVTLTEPAGDLGVPVRHADDRPRPRLATGEDFGVATGHDRNYGRFLVPSGPYMFKDSGTLDFSAPVERPRARRGVRPGRSIELVRNPS